MANRTRVAAIAVVLVSCAAPRPAPCAKDYAALEAHDLAVIEQGTAIEDGAKADAALTPEQRSIVANAHALLESRSRVADDKDVEIIDGARRLLRDESVWDRADDRECHDGDTSFSLYCALYFASRQVVGTYEHRRTSLQEVRFAVEDATQGRTYNHRLRDFNNDPQTRLQDIYAVLDVARSRLVQRIEQQHACK